MSSSNTYGHNLLYLEKNFITWTKNQNQTKTKSLNILHVPSYFLFLRAPLYFSSFFLSFLPSFLYCLSSILVFLSFPMPSICFPSFPLFIFSKFTICGPSCTNVSILIESYVSIFFFCCLCYWFPIRWIAKFNVMSMSINENFIFFQES